MLGLKFGDISHYRFFVFSILNGLFKMLLTGKSFVEEGDKVSMSFFQKLLEKQMRGLKLEGVHPTDPCQKLLLKYDQPAKNEEPLKNEKNTSLEIIVVLCLC